MDNNRKTISYVLIISENLLSGAGTTCPEPRGELRGGGRIQSRAGPKDLQLPKSSARILNMNSCYLLGIMVCGVVIFFCAEIIFCVWK